MNVINMIVEIRIIPKHGALIQKSYATELVGHISRDSTAIEAREKPIKKAVAEKVMAKRGCSKQSEERVTPQTRIEKQAAGMTLTDMIADLPTACEVATKQNSKGHQTSWIGYQLHLDVADGGIPVSGLLTSASTHDGQAAIPLAYVTNLENPVQLIVTQIVNCLLLRRKFCHNRSTKYRAEKC